MKTAIGQILTFSIWIGMLAGSQLLAQQTNLDKRSSHIAPSKTMYVAQQNETTNQSTINPTNNPASPQPPQNSTPTPASTSQPQPSDSVPGTIFPGIVPADQTPEAMTGDTVGVDNGLWEGCEPGNGCATCGGGYCAPPLWYTEQGVRILARSRPRKSPVTFQFASVPVQGQSTLVDVNFEEQDVHSHNYNVAVGYNATIGRYLGRDAMDRDDFLEFTYWGMNTWIASSFYDPGLGQSHLIQQGSTPIALAGRLNTQFFVNNRSVIENSAEPLGVVGFDNTERQRFSMDSEIHNWELNLRLRPRGRPDQLVLHPNGRWRRECQPGTFMSYLVGLRYMTVGEGFHFHSEGNIVDQSGTHSVSGNYDVLTQNDLLGLQIGTDLMFRRCKWSWGIRSKIGPYINFASNEKEIVNNPDGLPSFTVFNNRFTSRSQKASLIGEVGFEATYKFRPNLMGRAGYDFMWITSLALAPEQLTWSLDPPANATINTGGILFSHGISLGLEWCW